MSLHMSIKCVGLFAKEESLVICDDYISLGIKTILKQDILFIKTGITVTRVNGIQSGTSYNMTLGSKNGNICINLSDGFYGSKSKPIFDTIYSATMKHIGVNLLNRMLNEINNGGNIIIGDTAFTLGGVILPVYKMFVFKSGMETVPYKEIKTFTSNGEIRIESVKNNNACCVITIRETNNACLLPHLISILKGN